MDIMKGVIMYISKSSDRPLAVMYVCRYASFIMSD